MHVALFLAFFFLTALLLLFFLEESLLGGQYLLLAAGSYLLGRLLFVGFLILREKLFLLFVLFLNFFGEDALLLQRPIELSRCAVDRFKIALNLIILEQLTQVAIVGFSVKCQTATVLHIFMEAGRHVFTQLFQRSRLFALFHGLELFIFWHFLILDMNPR